jgi:hypothetical protein
LGATYDAYLHICHSVQADVKQTATAKAVWEARALAASRRFSETNLGAQPPPALLDIVSPSMGVKGAGGGDAAAGGECGVATGSRAPPAGDATAPLSGNADTVTFLTQPVRPLLSILFAKVLRILMFKTHDT